MRHNLRDTFSTILHQYMVAFKKPAYGTNAQGQKVQQFVKDPKTGKTMPKYVYPNMPRVTRSSLVLIQAIASGSNNLTFPVLTNQAPIGTTEIRLNLNDEFVITELGIMLYGAVGSSTGPAGTLSNRYWTYAPMQLNSGFIGVQPFYDSGTFTLTIDQTQYLRNWDTMQHEFVPRTQDNPYNAITTSGSPISATLGSRHLSDDGFVEMTPTITLSGARTNTLQLNWPNGITPKTNFEVACSDDSTDLFISLDHAAIVMRGFLAQNAAKFQGTQE